MNPVSPESARAIAVEVASGLWRVIRPGLGARAGEVVGTATSGDYTFAIDETAEDALPGLVAAAGASRGLRLAFYSEDRGLVLPDGDDPGTGLAGCDAVLVVDPIDGTRPAMCGLEGCVASVAVAVPPPGAATARLGDVAGAALVELTTGRTLSAARGGGVVSGHADGGPACETPIARFTGPGRDGVKHMFWGLELGGRPMEAVAAVLGPLTDASGLGGGVFVFSSSAFAISRVVTGQLDAYVDFYGALLTGPASAGWRAVSAARFDGKVFALFPYDIAAAAMLAEEAGCAVTDARGASLATLDLLDSTADGVTSIVVARGGTLAGILLRAVGSGMDSLESHLSRGVPLDGNGRNRL